IGNLLVVAERDAGRLLHRCGAAALLLGLSRSGPAALRQNPRYRHRARGGSVEEEGDRRHARRRRGDSLLRDRHVYILGKPGMGKSTLMLNMLRQDIERGKAVGLIDPAGDLAEAA